MSASDRFTASLLGYHDVRSNGGGLLPRRNTINFKNAVVEDRGGETQVTLSARPVWLPAAVLSADADDYAPAGLPECTDLSLSCTTARSVTGVESGGLVVYAKRIWNQSASAAIQLEHASSSSASGNRFLCPGSLPYSIAAGYAVRIIWSAADNLWRVIPCLA